MIIVEGPDGSGKTTLVQQLCDKYGFQIGMRGTVDRDLLYTVTVPDTMRAIAYAVHGVSRPIIWDRMYYSDFVYAPVQKREVAFNASHQMHIDAVIEALRCPIIVCLPPREVVLANIAAERHQMPGVKGRAEFIWEEYNDMVRVPDDGVKEFPEWRTVYDYTDPETLTNVHAEIGDYLENRQERRP